MENNQRLINDNAKYLIRKQKKIYKVFESLGALCSSFFNDGVSGFKKMFYIKKVNLEIRRHTSKKDRYPVEKTEYNGERVAVYTVLFGDIDSIINPLVIDPNCDYYIITEREVEAGSIWKKLDVDMSVVKGYSNRKKNRYFKMHAYELFPDYKYCIYIDANIVIYGELSKLIKYINPVTGLGIHNMPNRGNIYEEIFARSLIDPRDIGILNRQKIDYISQGYDGAEGMFECNVLAMMNSLKCTEIMKRWWNEYKKYPARDQVSFPYVLWRLGISQDEIGILGNCMRLNPFFRINEHIIK